MATPPPYPTYNYDKGGEPSAPPSQAGYYGPPPPSYSQPQQQPPAPYHQPQQPPPQPYYQPPQANYQQPARGRVPQTSHGLLGSLGNIGRDVAKGLNSMANDASTVYSRSVHGDILMQLQSGTTVVLVSRASGRSLEIVQASDGRLTLDAACTDSPHVFNNKWLVTKMPAWYTFSNYNNFLAIEGGQLFVATGIAGPQQAPPCARFKLAQAEHFVILESAITRGHYAAANERGEIKPPLASSKDKYAHFGVMFCSYQAPR